MNETSGTITIKNISHVLDLLVLHLYGSDPHLTLRELIQNAHDALLQLPDDIADRKITIELNVLTPPYYLQITDTGIGMSHEEIQKHLGNIGDSEKLQHAMERPDIIGRFGIGFLSSFIIADHVEVVTRKLGEKSQWLWETTDKQQWRLAERQSVSELLHGTRVRLYFRDVYPADYAERMNDVRSTDGVTRIVQTYCYLIPFPIQVGMVGDSPRRVNAVRAPWETDQEAAATYRVLFSRNDPLFTYRFSESDPKNGYLARGVLYFREQWSSVASVQLYVKRMLVNAEDREVIPPYAIFMVGLVDCPNLGIDLARRQVSQFDPAYKWLRRAMCRQYEAAFLRFATTQVDSLVTLWPNLDTTFINRLASAWREGDDDRRQAADSFLVNAGPYLPFYLVDLISGSQGRPIWRTIRELVDARRGEPGDGEKVRVYYTKSRSAVEKDMLLHTYRELIDVGREGSAHELLITLLQAKDDSFTDFVLEEVKASHFEEVTEGERELWKQAIHVVKSGVIFFGRSHDVVAEKFQPHTTPVVITDTNVDADELEAFRDHFTKPAHLGGDVGRKVLQMLEQMAGKGGVLTVHLNVVNPVLVQLRDALNASDTELKQAAEAGLAAIAWRAVLDYFGWTSTRDMIAKDRTHSHTIIQSLLQVTREAVSLREDLGLKVREVEEMRQRIADIDGASRQTEGRLDVIVGIVDMVDSTRLVIANPAAGPPQVAQFLRALIHEIEAQVRNCGAVPVSFTGDGLLFYLEQPSAVLQNVRSRFQHLSKVLELVCESKPELRKLIADHRQVIPRLRIALASGETFFGQIGPTKNLVGLPVVEAARLCAEKALYEEGKTELLVTGHAFDAGARWGIWRAQDFRIIQQQFMPKGLNRELTVYGPATDG
jgi:HSP90 family molecular chaperone